MKIAGVVTKVPLFIVGDYQSRMEGEIPGSEG